MAKVTFVFKNNLLTKFMQHADVFENFKVIFGGVIQAEIEPWNKEVLERIIKLNEGEPYGLIAAYGHNDVNTYEWFDPTVKVVSNGKEWKTFEDFIYHIKRGGKF